MLAATTAAGNIVTVNMNSAFGEITGTDTELAVGQIVATVAAENGNGTGVLFEIDGQRTQRPGGQRLGGGRAGLRDRLPHRPVVAGCCGAARWSGGQPAFSTSARQGTRGAPDHRCSRS